MNNSFYKITTAILLIVVIWMGWKINRIGDQTDKELKSLQKSIIESDSLRKEGEGQYSKLVDYFKTERDLNKQLKDSNKDLYKLIQKQNERILSLTNAVITLKEITNQGFGSINPNDSNIVDLNLYYPASNDWFINWDGSVNSKTAHYEGKWMFSKLPLEIILTEEERGIWKTRLIGPEWLIVDTLSINSLPPEKLTPLVERKLGFMVGGGYNKTLDNTIPNAISLGGGISWKNKHNLIFTVNTNKQIGLNYYIKLQKFKKR